MKSFNFRQCLLKLVDNIRICLTSGTISEPLATKTNFSHKNNKGTTKRIIYPWSVHRDISFVLSTTPVRYTASNPPNTPKAGTLAVLLESLQKDWNKLYNHWEIILGQFELLQRLLMENTKSKTNLFVPHSVSLKTNETYIFYGSYAL